MTHRDSEHPGNCQWRCLHRTVPVWLVCWSLACQPTAASQPGAPETLPIDVQKPTQPGVRPAEQSPVGDSGAGDGIDVAESILPFPFDPDSLLAHWPVPCPLRLGRYSIHKSYDFTSNFELLPDGWLQILAFLDEGPDFVLICRGGRKSWQALPSGYRIACGLSMTCAAFNPSPGKATWSLEPKTIAFALESDKSGAPLVLADNDPIDSKYWHLPYVAVVPLDEETWAISRSDSFVAALGDVRHHWYLVNPKTGVRSKPPLHLSQQWSNSSWGSGGVWGGDQFVAITLPGVVQIGKWLPGKNTATVVAQYATGEYFDPERLHLTSFAATAAGSTAVLHNNVAWGTVVGAASGPGATRLEDLYAFMQTESAYVAANHCPEGDIPYGSGQSESLTPDLGVLILNRAEGGPCARPVCKRNLFGPGNWCKKFESPNENERLILSSAYAHNGQLALFSVIKEVHGNQQFSFWLDEVSSCDAFMNCEEDVSGSCKTMTLSDCGDTNPCTSDLCDAAHGGCFHEPMPDGLICGPNKACKAGSCK